MKILKYSLWPCLSVLLFWSIGFAIYGYSSIQYENNVPQKTDVIVVLTGGADRIEKGLELFSKGISGNLFITGIHPSVTKADIMSRNDFDLPDCCIIYDHKATTTIENGIQTQQWLLQNPMVKSALLVTSDYHMHRARQEMKHVMPHIRVIPYRVESDPNNRTRLLFLEYHKFLYRAVMIRLGR